MVKLNSSCCKYFSTAAFIFVTIFFYSYNCFPAQDFNYQDTQDTSERRPSLDNSLDRLQQEKVIEDSLYEPVPEGFYTSEPSRYRYGDSKDADDSYVQKRSVFQKDPNDKEQDQFASDDAIEDSQSPIKISGNVQMGVGFTSDDIVWKKANYDLNENNWRTLDDSGYNSRENTYDPAVFSRLNVQVDDTLDKGFGFHANLDVSPWSFVGKSKKMTISSAGGDTAEVQLKYWGNSRYTLNERVYTLENGSYFNLPELKVVNDRILPTTVTTIFGDTFNISETEIEREFWPLRELWGDYSNDFFKIKVFPVALEKEAYLSDDPLGLSNHHIYWEESPWLDSWKQGRVNTGAIPNDFSNGYWDDSISFAVKDSDGMRLTNLRGASFSLFSDIASLDFTTASPKTLWQDYDDYDSVSGALRGKYKLGDVLRLGTLYTYKVGYNDDEKLDATNQVLGADISYAPVSNTKISFEAATSRDVINRTLDDYEKREKGETFHLSIINSSEGDILDKAYYEIQPNQDFLYRMKFSLTRMEEGFKAGLANYTETRDDAFWSRHLHFRDPFNYYSGGMSQYPLTWYDIEPYAIGDGVDQGRDVISYRLEFFNLLDSKLDTLFDYRNVHHSNGKVIENVVRIDTTYRPIEKLTAKILGIYHRPHKTLGGYDPFITDSDGDNLLNSAIEDGKDASLKTVSLGLEYELFDWLIPSFIWEHTNDYTVAYDNFPGRILDYTTMTRSYTGDILFRYPSTSLPNGGTFALPAYDYFDIFKVGLQIKPLDNLDIYVDWTRNENEWAQAIDDNSNHIGVEVAYRPFKKVGIYAKYVYSEMNDYSELNEDARVVKRSHHNFFTEIRLRLDEDSELVGQYGVGGISAGGLTASYSPYGGSLASLDTQHIVRLYYRRKF